MKKNVQTHEELCAMAVYHAESALLELTEQVVKAMEAQNLKRSTVARRLQTTKGRITQLLDGPNITFKTAAKLAQAVGLKFGVILTPQFKFESSPPPTKPITMKPFSLASFRALNDAINRDGWIDYPDSVRTGTLKVLLREDLVVKVDSPTKMGYRMTDKGWKLVSGV